jgi:hypothetical protein
MNQIYMLIYLIYFVVIVLFFIVIFYRFDKSFNEKRKLNKKINLDLVIFNKRQKIFKYYIIHNINKIPYTYTKVKIYKCVISQ